jgi:hypothetical protein
MLNEHNSLMSLAWYLLALFLPAASNPLWRLLNWMVALHSEKTAVHCWKQSCTSSNTFTWVQGSRWLHWKRFCYSFDENWYSRSTSNQLNCCKIDTWFLQMVANLSKEWFNLIHYWSNNRLKLFSLHSIGNIAFFQKTIDLKVILWVSWEYLSLFFDIF